VKYKVFLTDDATADLEEIHFFILQNDSDSAANHVLDHIEKAFRNLESYPNRGGHPKELLLLGVKEYREVFFKPYRIIYRVMDNRVNVHIIADGRRDMQTMLAWRLLRG
jgi:toxin ParE1/3/4